MIQNSQKQDGSAQIVILIATVIALLGFVGYVSWKNFVITKNETTSVAQTTDSVNETQAKTEYKTVKINNQNFRYPVNNNNEKIIIVPDESTPALQISYTSIRDYYADKNISDDCMLYVAGLMNVNTEKELIDHSILERNYGKNTIQDALTDGIIVQIDNNDLYVHGPFKQNETCTDIYENKDLKFQEVLSGVRDARLAWLKSLELVK